VKHNGRHRRSPLQEIDCNPEHLLDDQGYDSEAIPQRD
jgi:hypothetical protein